MTKPNTNAISPDEFVRFSLSQRLEHLVLMLCVTVLVLTGLPQKFAGEGWAQTMIVAMGGIETVRVVHRTMAILFCLEGIYHWLYISYLVGIGEFEPTMIPGMRDVRDALNAFKYCIGTAQSMPKFDRFDYRQKFEYWGVVLCWMVMVSSGLVLMFPAQATQILPGAFIPTAKEMHGGEALLVLLVMVTWHLYGAALNPQRFPGDASIFTGKISRARMMDEHPLEYARMLKRKPQLAAQVPPPTPGEETLPATAVPTRSRDEADDAFSDLMATLRKG